MRVIPQTLQDGYYCLHLPTNLSDEEIDDLIRKWMPRVSFTQKGIVCAFYGYEFDPRELYEIPEAIEQCKRLVERGFISVMHVSSLIDRAEKPFLDKKFGAFEVWSLATGNVNKEGDVPWELRDVFLKELDKANKVSAKLFVTADGQHRTRIK